MRVAGLALYICTGVGDGGMVSRKIGVGCRRNGRWRGKETSSMKGEDTRRKEIQCIEHKGGLSYKKIQAGW